MAVLQLVDEDDGTGDNDRMQTMIGLERVLLGRVEELLETTRLPAPRGVQTNPSSSKASIRSFVMKLSDFPSLNFLYCFR